MILSFARHSTCSITVPAKPLSNLLDPVSV
jgi:hypothetical protein